MKNILIFPVLLAVLIAGCSWPGRPAAEERPAPAEEKALVGGDSDEHGCIASAGYRWCAAEERCLRVFEEFCADTVEALVADIKAETGVALAPAGKSDFNWMVTQGEDTADALIAGVRHRTTGTKADFESVERYLDGRLVSDTANLANGERAGLRGYRGEYLACDLGFSGPAQSEALAITLICGYFNENDVPKLIIARKIQAVIARKYGKAVDEARVTIKAMDDTHAAGAVAFGPAGTPGGNFLAVAAGTDWQVVHDGNGAVDCAAMRSTYGFSDDLLAGLCD